MPLRCVSRAVCCSALQCVAVRCRVCCRVCCGVCCSELQCVAVGENECCGELQCVAVGANDLETACNATAVCFSCSALQCILQCIAALHAISRCSFAPTATHCNTLHLEMTRNNVSLVYGVAVLLHSVQVHSSSNDSFLRNFL